MRILLLMEDDFRVVTVAAENDDDEDIVDGGVEKPLLHENRACSRAARRSKRIMMVGSERRFWDE